MIEVKYLVVILSKMHIDPEQRIFKLLIIFILFECNCKLHHLESVTSIHCVCNADKNQKCRRRPTLRWYTEDQLLSCAVHISVHLRKSRRQLFVSPLPHTYNSRANDKAYS